MPHSKAMRAPTVTANPNSAPVTPDVKVQTSTATSARAVPTAASNRRKAAKNIDKKAQANPVVLPRIKFERLTTFLSEDNIAIEKEFQERMPVITDYFKSVKNIDSRIYDACIILGRYYNATPSIQNKDYDQLFKEWLGGNPKNNLHLAESQKVLLQIFRKELFIIFAKSLKVEDFNIATPRTHRVNKFKKRANEATSLFELKVAVNKYWDSRNGFRASKNDEGPNQYNEELWMIIGELFHSARQVVPVDEFDAKGISQTAAAKPKNSAPLRVTMPANPDKQAAKTLTSGAIEGVVIRSATASSDTWAPFDIKAAELPFEKPDTTLTMNYSCKISL